MWAAKTTNIEGWSETASCSSTALNDYKSLLTVIYGYNFNHEKTMRITPKRLTTAIIMC